MAQTDHRSLQQIRQETERTRAGLTDTVEQLRRSITGTTQDLRERISPAAIKAEVSGYVRSRGERLLENAVASARQNPIQAAAVGAGLAYPLFRLVRTIPLPLWMIGAGLYLAGSNRGEELTRKASELVTDLSNEGTQRVRALGDQLGNVVDSAKEAVAGDSADQAGNTSSKSEPAASDHRSFTEAARTSATEALQSAQESASDLGDRASRSVRDTVEHNPLVVAGLGLLIGGVIASALPRTNLENDVVGSTSNSVKRRVWTAASQGLETAEEAASEAARRAADQADREGFSRDGLRERANDLKERVRHVADAAVTTAFEPPEDHQSSDSEGDKTHG